MATSNSRHPIEILHNGRDEIQRAASLIDQGDRPDTGELDSIGSTVVAMVASLWHLSDALARKLYQYSDREIDEHTEENDPVSDYHKAVDLIVHMRDILSVAYTDADQYWSAIQQVHRHTSSRPHGGQEDEDDH